MSLRRWIVGIGSHQGWDCIGWRVADRLEGRVPASVRLAGSPIEIFDVLDDCGELILIDACRTYSSPGLVLVQGKSLRLHRWKWPDPSILQTRWSGTHDLGITGVLQMAEHLGMLPDRVELWGIDVAMLEEFNHPLQCELPNTMETILSGNLETFIQEIVSEYQESAIE